jgi:16S rRNA (cytosine1402-N4)-methyltransferase
LGAHTTFHEPVLVAEVCDYLITDPEATYVDATVGGGGHALALLQRLGPRGKVVGIDRDPEALKEAQDRLAPFAGRFLLTEGDFGDIEKILHELGVGDCRGVLFDLGVSSHQIDTAERGFSYMRSARLDMRMSPRQSLTAYAIVNDFPEAELTDLIRRFGEERRARAIARAIVQHRKQKPIQTTTELADIVSSVAAAQHRIKTLSRVFQALRIAVNQELESLERGLRGALNVVEPGGRISVITYHSLEARIVKEFFRRESSVCVCPPEFPVCVCGKVGRLKLLTRRAITPSADEIERNPRARSAKLRVAEVTAATAA